MKTSMRILADIWCRGARYNLMKLKCRTMSQQRRFFSGWEAIGIDNTRTKKTKGSVRKKCWWNAAGRWSHGAQGVWKNAQRVDVKRQYMVEPGVSWVPHKERRYWMILHRGGYNWQLLLSASWTLCLFTGLKAMPAAWSLTMMLKTLPIVFFFAYARTQGKS